MNPIAFDIETLGFCADNPITVIGMYNGTDMVISINTEGDDIDDRNIDGVDELIVNKTETELLESIPRMLNMFEIPHTLCAWYGETWKGGFDIPKVRTACVKNGVSWPLENENYLELIEVYRKRFNTTVPEASFGRSKDPWVSFAEFIGLDVDGMKMSEVKDAISSADYTTDDLHQWADENGNDVPTSDVSELDVVYETLVGPQPYDPLEGDSSLCVEKWQNGEFDEVILHNVADLKMTHEMAEIATTYAKPHDLRPDTL